MLRSVSRELTLFCKSLLVCVLVAPLTCAVIYSQKRALDETQKNAPLTVIRSYLRATYARDYGQAYRLISAADQRFRDEKSYVHGQQEYTGFTARLAGKLADFMEVKVIEEVLIGDRARITVEYRVPSPGDLSSLVFNWDSRKLNSLSAAEQTQLLETLRARKQSGQLVEVQGHETLELTREGNAWRIFQDWSAGIRVKFEAAGAEASDVDIKLSQSEIIAKGNEPFQINLKLRNRGSQPVVLALRHRVEPEIAANELEMIECGVGRRLALGPGSEQEFSMAYMLGESIRESLRDLTLTYAFEIEK
jgi:hypothetical protein